MNPRRNPYVKIPKKEQEPKNLNLKIGSKLEVMWNTVLTNAKIELEVAEQTVLIQKELIIVAGRKVREEQKRGKDLNTAK